MIKASSAGRIGAVSSTLWGNNLSQDARAATKLQRSYLLTSAPARSSKETEDFLVCVARAVFFMGLFMVSLLVFRLGSFTIGDGLLIVSAAILMIAPRNSRKSCIKTSSWVAFSLIFFGALLAVSVSPNTVSSVEIAVRVLYVACVLPWQARRLLSTPALLSAACVVFAAGAALCGFGTLLQARFGGGIIPGSEVTNAGRYAGFTGHVSDTGGITALAVVIGVAGLGKGTTKKSKLASLLFVAGGLIGLTLSGSVSGMLSAAAGVALIVLMGGIGLTRIMMLAGAAASALYVAQSVITSTANALDPIERFYQAVGLIPNQSQGLNTTASRLETDRLGWESFLRNPLTGVGLDPESGIVDHYSNLSVHNFLIGALHAGGILFAAGLTVAALTPIFSALRLLSPNALALRTFAMAAAAIVFCITAPSYYNRYFWVPIALLAAYQSLASKCLLPRLPEQRRVKSSESTKLGNSEQNVRFRLAARAPVEITGRRDPACRRPQDSSPTCADYQ